MDKNTEQEQEEYYTIKYIKYKEKYIRMQGGFLRNMIGKMMTKTIPGGNFYELYREISESGLINNENKEIIMQLINNGIHHLTDITYYPLVLSIFKNLLLLIGSAETLTPPLILFTLGKLKSSLMELKMKYPDDFILLSKFLSTNREKILPIINNFSMMNPEINKIAYDLLNNILKI